MKTKVSRIFEYAFMGMMVLLYAGLAFWRTHPYPLKRIPGAGIRSYFVFSGNKGLLPEDLPVIIHIANTFERPTDLVPQFLGNLNEPVLLIWSGLLSDLDPSTDLEDVKVCERKRREFSRMLSVYEKVFRFDKGRVYLTGSGFGGAYAWTLAYDRPSWYAGVVAISAPCYPRQIQSRLVNGKEIVTVLVYGGKATWRPDRLAQVMETGRTIEALNQHSRFFFKTDEDNIEVRKYWLENLSYILNFTKAR